MYKDNDMTLSLVELFCVRKVFDCTTLQRFKKDILLPNLYLTRVKHVKKEDLLNEARESLYGIRLEEAYIYVCIYERLSTCTLARLKSILYLSRIMVAYDYNHYSTVFRVLYPDLHENMFKDCKLLFRIQELVKNCNGDTSRLEIIDILHVVTEEVQLNCILAEDELAYYSLLHDILEEKTVNMPNIFDYIDPVEYYSLYLNVTRFN
ncbi:hypothetical protein CWI38_0060p0050 [Hamiltosporidium tvaerminnensis]|uniref:Uncharacterized protein n=2 Tax=Hamiltosporidium TaxID=1176354 RepID=A0A4Q9L7R5_9MICR|nr:hypothetical protein CWI39_1160p0020 [Hamiltosporidium magnivora]TBU02961.1 hypothetical protein CWI37_0383p0020 [Hamiltosporidium tvaerminnensis]TBU20505.1 hypothetical protein CWI38_0060p0050 [Hamiltosporidium tvaerminnensis]